MEPVKDVSNVKELQRITRIMVDWHVDHGYVDLPTPKFMAELAQIKADGNVSHKDCVLVLQLGMITAWYEKHPEIAEQIKLKWEFEKNNIM